MMLTLQHNPATCVPVLRRTAANCVDTDDWTVAMFGIGQLRFSCKACPTEVGMPGSGVPFHRHTWHTPAPASAHRMPAKQTQKRSGGRPLSAKPLRCMPMAREVMAPPWQVGMGGWAATISKGGRHSEGSVQANRGKGSRALHLSTKHLFPMYQQSLPG